MGKNTLCIGVFVSPQIYTIEGVQKGRYEVILKSPDNPGDFAGI